MLTEYQSSFFPDGIKEKMESSRFKDTPDKIFLRDFFKQCGDNPEVLDRTTLIMRVNQSYNLDQSKLVDTPVEMVLPFLYAYAHGYDWKDLNRVFFNEKANKDGVFYRLFAVKKVFFRYHPFYIDPTAAEPLGSQNRTILLVQKLEKVDQSMKEDERLKKALKNQPHVEALLSGLVLGVGIDDIAEKYRFYTGKTKQIRSDLTSYFLKRDDIRSRPLNLIATKMLLGRFTYGNSFNDQPIDANMLRIGQFLLQGKNLNLSDFSRKIHAAIQVQGKRDRSYLKVEGIKELLQDVRAFYRLAAYSALEQIDEYPELADPNIELNDFMTLDRYDGEIGSFYSRYFTQYGELPVSFRDLLFDNFSKQAFLYKPPKVRLNSQAKRLFYSTQTLVNIISKLKTFLQNVSLVSDLNMFQNMNIEDPSSWSSFFFRRNEEVKQIETYISTKVL